MASETPFPMEEFLGRALEGLWLSFGTFMVTVVLELWSLDTVKKVLSQTGGSSLYSKAVSANLRNHFLFGSPLYTLTSLPLCRSGKDLGMWERLPDPVSLQLSVAIISVANVLLHTPKLIDTSERVLPRWWVSTSDHVEHHRKLNTKYAAPTFNLDHFVSVLSQGISSSSYRSGED
eukprot:scaffold52_cov183-Cylindrotheca_fusiformis.AAC.18